MSPEPTSSSIDALRIPRPPGALRRVLGLRFEIIANLTLLMAFGLLLVLLTLTTVVAQVAVGEEVSLTRSVAAALLPPPGREIAPGDLRAFGLRVVRAVPKAGGLSVGLLDPAGGRGGEWGSRPLTEAQWALALDALRSGSERAEVTGVHGPIVFRGGALSVALPLEAGGKPTGALVVVRPLDRASDLLVRLRRWLLFDSLVLFLALVTLGTWLLSRRILEPTRALIGMAQAVAQGSLDRRVRLLAPREFLQLAEALNTMLDKLRDGRREQEQKARALADANEELRRSQDAALAADRLATLGRVAAGVAHEVGNPLTTITSALDLIEREGSRDADPSLVGTIRAEVGRIDGIVRGLLDLGRPRPLSLRPLEIRTTVQEALALLRIQGRLKGVEVVWEEGGSGLPPPLALADADLLRQAAVNLILNAADAMGGKGRIRLAEALRETPGETWVVLSVHDTGPGIPQADRARIFEPFFTTKKPGEGSGLGLSIVRNVTEAMGGRVEADAPPEGGARFTLLLPAAPPRQP